MQKITKNKRKTHLYGAYGVYYHLCKILMINDMEIEDMGNRRQLNKEVRSCGACYKIF